MEYFKYGDLNKWQGVENGMSIKFEAQSARKVALSFIANGFVEVWVDDENSEGRLVAYAQGAFEVSYIIDQTHNVRVIWPDEEGVSCFIYGHAVDQRFTKTDLPSATNIEPRRRRVMPEFEMLERIRVANAEKRRLELETAYVNKLTELETRLSATSPAPAPTPAPAPEPEVSTNEN